MRPPQKVTAACSTSSAPGIVVDDPDTARDLLRNVVAAPGRTRPFHWHQEGPTARDAMCDAIDQLGVVSHIAVGHPTARHGQEAARAQALGHVLPRLLTDGVVEILIEHRSGRQDKRDEGVILDVLQAEGRSGTLAYRWVVKTEPLVWIADALGGVVVRLPTRAGHHGPLRPTASQPLPLRTDLLQAGQIDALSPKMRQSRLPS